MTGFISKKLKTNPYDAIQSDISKNQTSHASIRYVTQDQSDISAPVNQISQMPHAKIYLGKRLTPEFLGYTYN